MTIREAYKHTVSQLSGLYNSREATAMADWVLTHLTGFNKTERLVHGDNLLRATQEATLSDQLSLLRQYKPVQYVLHEAWFASLKFYVNEQVLIPRPETEELVEWIVQNNRDIAEIRILDIGTGSGCIPISLKKQLPQATVHAVDVSAAALDIARQNAQTHQVAIDLQEVDILDTDQWNRLPIFDCIVSNPPYIREQEKREMHENVLAHEPHLALFVPDHDALLFYRTIAEFAVQHLSPGGQLYFEINEAFGKETVALLAEKGFTGIELRQDLQGKDRMVKALISH